MSESSLESQESKLETTPDGLIICGIHRFDGGYFVHQILSENEADKN